MRKLMLATAALAAMATNLAVVAPAAAQVAGPRAASVAQSATGGSVVPVRWQHRHWRGGYHRGGYGGGYYHDDAGPAVAAGIAGLLIGGALAAQAQSQGNSVGYCEQRFRSYDPGSGTYLGYDGNRHSCP